MPSKNEYDLAEKGSDKKVRAGLRRRLSKPNAKVEEIARRVHEAEAISQNDLNVIINT